MTSQRFVGSAVFAPPVFEFLPWLWLPAEAESHIPQSSREFATCESTPLNHEIWPNCKARQGPPVTGVEVEPLLVSPFIPYFCITHVAPAMHRRCPTGTSYLY